MSSTLRRTLLALAVLAAVALAAAVAVAPPSQAAPAWDTTTYYFSDASHSTIVGTKDVLCSGQIIIDGQVTSFRQTYYNNPC